jgi:hypothetical protein
MPFQAVPGLLKNFAVLTGNSATNPWFDSNLCIALICRNDAIDLYR